MVAGVCSVVVVSLMVAGVCSVVVVSPMVAGVCSVVVVSPAAFDQREDAAGRAAARVGPGQQLLRRFPELC